MVSILFTLVIVLIVVFDVAELTNGASSSPIFAFVTPSKQRKYNKIDVLPQTLHTQISMKPFIIRRSHSFLHSHQSPTASMITTSNYTDESQDYQSPSHDNDIVAMMTSKALEEHEDPSFFAATTTDADTISTPIPTIMDLNSDKEHSTTNIGVTNVIQKEPMQQSIVPNQLEPHIYHFNKAMIDTIYGIICTLYPVTKKVEGAESAGTTPTTISPHTFARFYVLETVARVPYFAYLSVLHLRETLGERTYSSSSGTSIGEHEDNVQSSINNSRLRTHYAEADNELHHLLIMESLGGNANPIDRAIAQCMAVGYYWYVVFAYTMISPQAAYHLSELIEDHAYHTYDEFLTTYENELKQLPVPAIAKQYYMNDNSYLLDLCRTVKEHPVKCDENIDPSSMRPKTFLNSLYDVFVCIRDDEKEHWKTLCNLVQYDHMSAVAFTNTNDNDAPTIPYVQSTQPKQEQ